MSKQLEFELPIVELRHQSGYTVLSLATDQRDLALTHTASGFAQTFAQALQKHMLRKGRYIDFMRFFNQVDYTADTVEVSIPPSPKRLDKQQHTISLHALKWLFDDGAILATIPCLGVAYYNARNGTNDNAKNYLDQLAQVVQLNLKKMNRFDSHHRLIELQWYDAPEVSQQPITAEFYTASELEKISRGNEERLLPKTASRMNRTAQKFFGIDSYLQDMLKNLQGEFKQSVLIVGPPGSGKTALVHAYEQAVGREWKQKPWMTSAARLIQALTEDGAWQYGLGKWTNELRERGEVVYIGALAEWFEVGQYAGNSISVAEALRDSLQRNEILLIAETTEEQLDKLELRSPGYRDMFHIIEFHERSEEAENNIARSAITDLGKLYRVAISKDIIDKILSLQRRYMPYSGYPGKTIRFFESIILHQHTNIPTISRDVALSAFCEESGMPRFLIDESLSFDAIKATDFFTQRVIGQEVALKELTDAIVTTKAGMTRSGKPIISLLFIGPTGVGKTQLAKTLAEYIFGDENRMIRLDMSEYGSPYSIPRLTSTSESSLAAKVRQQPFSVVLFDEIEKAAYNFFDLLLQVLGEGRLTDDSGNVANFCSTIIIMTSNLGAQDFMRPSIGFTHNSGEISDHFEDAVKKHFRPELFNRLDKVVPFIPLSSNEKQQIIKKEVNTLLKVNGVTKRPVQITIAPSAWEKLDALNIDFRYGTRAIQRELRKWLVQPLSVALCAYRVSDPLQITVSFDAKQSNERMMVDCQKLSKAKKSIGFFAQFVDKVSAKRRCIQGLEEGGTWISLQSEQDKLEQLKLRKKDKFWENPGWVQRASLLDALASRFSEIKNDIFQLEDMCIEQIKIESPDVLWDDYESQLDTINQKFHELLFDIAATETPENNQILLGIYGAKADRRFLSHFYEELIQEFNHAETHYYCYHIKEPVSYSTLEQRIDIKQEDIELNRVPASKEERDEIKYSYWKSKTEIKQDFCMLIGELYWLKSPCVALFYLNESGVIEFDNGENQKEKAFIDLSRDTPENYAIPEGIERREYYKNLKVARKVIGADYIDNRFNIIPQKPTALATHKIQIETQVERLLQEKLIKQTKIRETK